MDSLRRYKLIGFVILSLLLLLGCSKSSEESPKDADFLKENRSYLKDMVLCRCLYSIDSSLKINEASTGFFFHRSSYNPDIFDKIDTVVKNLKPNFEGEGNTRLGVAECIHLFKSDTLEKEIVKLDTYIIPE